MTLASHNSTSVERPLLLASPKASYITGATLAADGGRTAI
jgi:NAD(P)-dependent dehydrogenase (short-subunit alcohol dehydrogenase family)